jgi:hypothetical protein
MNRFPQRRLVRVMMEKKVKQFEEYRTRHLDLEALDRLGGG